MCIYTQNLFVQLSGVDVCQQQINIARPLSSVQFSSVRYFPRAYYGFPVLRV